MISLARCSNFYQQGQVSTGLILLCSSSEKSRETAINLKPSGISREKLEPLPGDTSTVMCEFL
jgi:hypothetical protein